MSDPLEPIPAPDPAGATAGQQRWWPLASAGLVVLTVVFCFGTSWVGIWGSHPAYWITLLLSALFAVGLAVWARRTAPGPVRSTIRTWGWRTGLALFTVIIVGFLVYLRPLGAEDVALDALDTGRGVSTSTSSSLIHLRPDNPKHTGLVFYPGAKVDPRAYARILRPIAEAGYPVVIVKFPYNLAVLGISSASDVIGKADDVGRWVLGGHSLGGAMAATYAAKDHNELAGLLLYAAYPASDMSDRQGLDIVSVSGTNDGLATVDDIAASRADLPAGTLFVPIDGGIHAYFGDYGPQSGDGTATISRDDAQSQIIDATLALIIRVDGDH